MKDESIIHLAVTLLSSAAAWIGAYFKYRPKEKADINDTIVASAEKLVRIADSITANMQMQLTKQDEVILAQKETIIYLTNEERNCKESLKAVTDKLHRIEAIHAERRDDIQMISLQCKQLKNEADNIKNSVDPASN